MTMTRTWTLLEKLRMLLTDLEILKEQSGKKRYLGVLTHPIAIIQSMKISVSKEKVVCLHIQRLCGQAIFELCNQISSLKQKI